MKTYAPTADVKASGIVVMLASTASRVAIKSPLWLTGKAKPHFTKHMDCGDYGIVINAAQTMCYR